MAYRNPAALHTALPDRMATPPVCVQFFAWTAWGDTAYQKGQFAGFSEEEAARIVKAGVGRIVHRQVD